MLFIPYIALKTELKPPCIRESTQTHKNIVVKNSYLSVSYKTSFLYDINYFQKRLNSQNLRTGF